MKKVHIVTFGYADYAFKSITKATEAVKFFSNLKRVRFAYDGGGTKPYYHPRREEREDEVELKLNQLFREFEEPEKVTKPLALPKPKRGTIRCICGFSDVAPKTTCAHCGRLFHESHNRTHVGEKTGSTLRLV